MWGVKPVYSHFWIRCGLEAVICPVCPQQRKNPIQEKLRQTFICEYYEKQEAVLSHLTSYTGQKDPGRILQNETSYFTQEKCCCLALLPFINFECPMYRGGVTHNEERASFFHSNLLQTCCWRSAFLQNNKISLIALKRTHLSVFSLCLSLHFIIQY